MSSESLYRNPNSRFDWPFHEVFWLIEEYVTNSEHGFSNTSGDDTLFSIILVRFYVSMVHSLVCIGLHISQFDG